MVSPTRIDFHRTKYGREILIDIAWIHEMPTFVHEEPHWLSFYDVTLVTRGAGDFWLDGHRYPVHAGEVFFTTPGQVRRWDVRALDGLCLFFPPTFLAEFLQDAEFLHRLPYFHVTSAAAAVRLPPAARQRLQRAFARMRAELRAWKDDSSHLLRARLYEELVQLARQYAHSHETAAAREPNRLVHAFRRAVERDVATAHGLDVYARALGVSVSHLTRLCHRHLGVSAKEVVQARLEVVARRALLFSEAPIGRIARNLGFGDASYFIRFFRRRTGESPARFRAALTSTPHADVHSPPAPTRVRTARSHPSARSTALRTPPRGAAR